MKYYAIWLIRDSNKTPAPIPYYTPKLGSLLELEILISHRINERVEVTGVYRCEDIIEFKEIFNMADEEIAEILRLKTLGSGGVIG